jgi:phosphopantetheinyl transferase (holo-ACP synthase)
VIGNDIIDLSLGAGRLSHNRRKRWLQKVATPAEWTLLKEWPQFLWPDILWSIKESVFKCRSGKRFDKSFVPMHIRLISVTSMHNNKGSGFATWREELFNVRFSITDQWLHAMASYDDNEPHWRSISMNDTSNCSKQSLQLKTDIVRHMNTHWPEQWYVEDDPYGIPRLFSSSNGKIALSISHHGRFGAWAILGSTSN